MPKQLNPTIKEEAIRRHLAGETTAQIYNAMAGQLAYSTVYKYTHEPLKEPIMARNKPLPEITEACTKVATPTYLIRPVTDGEACAMESFRRSVHVENFKISSHANDRMVKRGIKLSEIKQAVQYGTLSKGKFREGYVGGLFVYNGLIVAMYGLYKVMNAPVIVTIFRAGEEDDYQIGELQVETPVPSGRDVDSMSDEELEALLLDRRFKKAEAQKRQQERELNELQSRETKLIAELLQVQRDILERGGTVQPVLL